MKQTKLLSAVIGLACLSSTPAFADVSSRIINGQEATSDKWPFMVALVSKNVDAFNGQFCGASFIGKRYVLTAAHCIETVSPEELDVVIGVSDLASSDAGNHRYSVKNIYAHENYGEGGMGNDIAIIELTEMPQENTVALVDRHTRGNLSAGQMLTVMGWGDQDASNNYSTSSKLYQVDVPLVNQATCKASGGIGSNYRNIGDDAFCAGYENGGYDSCQGDSGGPIVIETNGTYEQLGIVSWGDGCAQANAYGVYANVSHFEAWIATYTTGFSFRKDEFLGAVHLGVISHTFEFGNFSDQVINVSSVNSVNGAVIVNNGCQNIAIGSTCQIEVSKNISSLGEQSFGVELNTNVAGLETITSEVRVTGARSLNSQPLSLITIPYEDVLSTEFWMVDGNKIISPSDLGHNEKAKLSIQGIPKGTVTFDVSVSSEERYDKLNIVLNGAELTNGISGTWSDTVTLNLVRSTNNTLEITYEKDGSATAGDDRVTLSNLSHSNEILISKSNGTQVAKSGSSSGGGSFGWHWLLMLAGVGLLRKRH